MEHGNSPVRSHHTPKAAVNCRHRSKIQLFFAPCHSDETWNSEFWHYFIL